MGRLFLLLALVFIPVDVIAGLDFHITPPTLTNANPEFAESINQAISDSEDELEAYFNQAFSKPLFLGSFSGAFARLDGFPGPWLTTKTTVGLRISGTVEIDSWDFPEIQDRFRRLNEESDYPWGAGFQPLWIEGRYSWAFGEGFWLMAGGGGNLFSVQQSDFRVSGGGGRLTGSLTKQGQNISSWCRWEGVRVETSLGWQTFQFLTSLPLEPVYETAYLPSPIPPDQPVTLMVIPEVSGGIQSQGFSWPILVSSALTLADQFTFHGGVGVVIGSFSSALVIDGQAEITLLPEDRGLITDENGVEHPGKLTVTGSVGSTGGPVLQPLLTGGFQARFGNFFLHLPVQWKPAYGLGLALEAGATF